MLFCLSCLLAPRTFNLVALSVLHSGEEEHQHSVKSSNVWGPTESPSRAPTQHRTMERCLTLFHLQGFSLTCFTWVNVFTDQQFAVAWAQGGPPAILYGGMLAICGTALVTLSLAEVASACPSIGGEFQQLFVAASDQSLVLALISCFGRTHC